jgi:NAD(P)-dependent dehydrogenase (short-subunit alcohol dehydrogenase family)
MAGVLEGQATLITGGASGIGAACAIRFAQEGADVLLADLLPDRAADTVAAVEALGRRAVVVACDTSIEADSDAAAQRCVDEFGRLDVVVAAAGVSTADYVSGETAELDDDRTASFIANQNVEHWEKVLAVNLTGVMLTDRSCARQMIELGNGGSIINIASIMAKFPQPGAANYCVSKAGVWMLTKVLSQELVPEGIRVNAIGPGFIETPMTAAISGHEELNQWVLSLTPMRRFGQPEEVAKVALFLASDEASYVSGEIIHPDGGWFTD